MVILMILASAAVVGAGIFVGSGLAVALIRFRVERRNHPRRPSGGSDDY
jgi:hypothetical protein